MILLKRDGKKQKQNLQIFIIGASVSTGIKCEGDSNAAKHFFKKKKKIHKHQMDSRYRPQMNIYYSKEVS